MRFSFLLAIASLLSLALVATANADTVYLKNGSAIDGTVLGTHDGLVILRIGNVGRTEIAEKDIENIEKNDRTGYIDPGRKNESADKIVIEEQDAEGGEGGKGPELPFPEAEDDKDAIDPETEQEIKQLAYELTRQRSTHRVRAERKLSRMGPVVVPYVLPLTKNPFVRTRVAAFRLLKKHGDKSEEVIEACLSGFEDEDRFVRQLAWQALKRISGKAFRFPWDDESATDRQRTRALRKWRGWWQEEQKRRQIEADAKAVEEDA